MAGKRLSQAAVKATGGKAPRKTLAPKLARDFYYRSRLNRGIVAEVETQTYESRSDAQTQAKDAAVTTSASSQTSNE